MLIKQRKDGVLIDSGVHCVRPPHSWMIKQMNQWLKIWLRVVLVLFVAIGMSISVAEAKPKKTAAAAKETITYVVKKGDTVGKIANTYHVNADDIARWNNLANAAQIRIGQKLRIRVPKGSVSTGSSGSGSSKSAGSGVTYVTQNVSYVVKKGDNLGKISRKTGVSIEDLKKHNKSLRKHPDQLRVGQTLILREQKVLAGSGVSRGLANNGSLSGGIQLKDGPGYHVRNGKRAYGTPLTVSLIMDAMAAYHNKFPKGPQFSIGDLSVQGGGKLSPHLSHQSGRDVDITYIRDSAGKLDVEKNWFLIEYFLKTKKVQYIFVDYNLQADFYKFARSKGYSEAELRTLIQYPNGKQSYMAIVRHSKGHVSHLHVRFVCASTDVNCH